ncbi:MULTISPECIES: alpha-E domain-containing protein [unclassified Zunongwangia]|uniref:alpha-E domain-containing protein n=1 Tax=unclassified Zunongwangia TaxID=2632541 RepID=UPI0022DE651B|nr:MULTISPECIES: alpha-E domain-containing protein [unclassified Zunongwangia]WBL23658.1 alpha-E domain-containing protein [Zunongwangia sp. HRR-M8]WBL24397.1 alpha-E domain-containing protein [Zunongwangia sp. HGR-M22]
MLSRVANNLFWMGRYIERSEHIARYLNVNYFSSLDAPNELSQSRQFVLRSMLFMASDPVDDPNIQLDEEKVLFDIALNKENPGSIISYLQNARENANSARDLISTELYEALNKFYHYTLNYPIDKFVKNGLYEFTVNVAESTSILKAKVQGTLLHDDVYSIIMLGINIERATQIIRIINAKYNDANLAGGSYGDHLKNSYEWTTLLKCTESYDMMRRFYKKPPRSLTTLEFLILNPLCPRSVMTCLNEVCKHIDDLSSEKSPSKHSAEFLVGKVKSEYQFKVIEEIEEDLQSFIERILKQLNDIAKKIEFEYFL